MSTEGSMTVSAVASSADVADRILRRSRVSKMTRELQKRLTLANVKIQHGWEAMSLDVIRPQVEKELKRKRSSSPANSPVERTSRAIFPRLSSSSSVHTISSKDYLKSDSSHPGSGPKRARRVVSAKSARSVSSAASHQFKASGSKWKDSDGLPHLSSTLHSHISPRNMFIHKPPYSAGVHHGSSTSPVPLDSDDASPYSSETDDEDLPLPPPHPRELRSKASASTIGSGQIMHIRSSPPPMGSPRSKMASLRVDTNVRKYLSDGETTTDSLFFVSNSPPLRHAEFLNTTLASHPIAPPPSPPPKNSHLPSSLVALPGMPYPEFAPICSGDQLNFDDFFSLNCTATANIWRHTPSRSRASLDQALPSVSIFADPALTSTSMSLFGGSLDFGDL